MTTAGVRVIKRKGDITIKTYSCSDPVYAVTQVLMDSRVINALKGRECDIEMVQENTIKFQSLLAKPVAAPAPAAAPEPKAKAKK